MVTLDNVLVSVPNQELLKGQIDNFGSDRTIRRQIKITPGFEYNVKEVEAALLEAADKSPGILKDPKPYVWVTRFQDYAVEYTLYVFISDTRGLPKIEAELRRTVLDSCKVHKIDISTPLLIKRIQEAAS
jgi:small-conductance mechanosensitive channel